MLDLAFTVACSLATAMLLKVVEVRRLDRAAVLAGNYVVAAAIAVALSGGAAASLPTEAVVLGLVVGALFFGGYYVFGVAIARAGVGLATGVMRLSVAVPVLGSWVLFSEMPSSMQGVGLFLAGAAFVLMARSSDDASAGGAGLRDALVLGLLFAVGGAVDLAMNVYARLFGGGADAGFLVVVFGTAAALASAVTLTRVRAGARPGRQEAFLGLAIGLSNFGSAAFVIRAATALPAALVFPTLSISLTAGAALLGVLWWRERLSRANVAGLAIAAGALALLWGGA